MCPFLVWGYTMERTLGIPRLEAEARLFAKIDQSELGLVGEPLVSPVWAQARRNVGPIPWGTSGLDGGSHGRKQLWPIPVASGNQGLVSSSQLQ